MILEGGLACSGRASTAPRRRSGVPSSDAAQGMTQRDQGGSDSGQFMRDYAGVRHFLICWRLNIHVVPRRATSEHRRLRGAEERSGIPDVDA